jgi:peptidyl-prolyl cis-trans isomerase C
MGDTVDTFREKLDRDLLLREYMNQQFFSKATVSQDDVQGFYNQNKEQFIAPAQVKASHILVKEQELATEIRDKLADGADFGELAMEFSTCPSKKKGGDLGFFSKGKMVPEFEAAAFSMDKGTVSDPVKTQFGYHLIQVTEKAEEHKQGFQEVEEAIKNHMVGVAADKKIGEMLDTLRESAEIIVERVVFVHITIDGKISSIFH